MLHEVSFASYNERDQVQAWIYVPACKPNGIVQFMDLANTQDAISI